MEGATHYHFPTPIEGKRGCKRSYGKRQLNTIGGEVSRKSFGRNLEPNYSRGQFEGKGTADETEERTIAKESSIYVKKGLAHCGGGY